MNNKITTRIHIIKAYSPTVAFYVATGWCMANENIYNVISVGGEQEKDMFTLELQYETKSGSSCIHCNDTATMINHHEEPICGDCNE